MVLCGAEQEMRMKRVFVGMMLAALAAPTGAAAQAPAAGNPPPGAAQPAAPAPAAPAQAVQQPVADAGQLLLTAGRSMVLTVPFDITRIAITDPKIADAVAVQQREVLIDGKSAGTVSLIVWGAGRRSQYDIVVDPGVTTLQQTLNQLFPGEEIRVAVSEDAVILVGNVSSTQVMLKAAEIAGGVHPKARVINMLQLPGGHGSQQVMLQVRFAEVNRAAMKELGASLLLNAQRFSGRTTTQQFAAPDFDEEGDIGSLVFSDFLNLFFFDRREGIGGVVKALESKGFFQSLAEPNLIAYNGQEASFLAGGEFPVPIVQGNTGSVSVLFKEFGVRLTFRPTIAGDAIRLRVKPEVSALDFNNGVTVAGFRIPALSTRRAETDVELRDGQSFAIAGLLNNITQEDVAGVPILSKLPILGNFFKSRAERAERTELMVIVTPRLVQPLEPDEVPPLPTQEREFLPSAAPGPRGTADDAAAPKGER
jgi:pilus assembly protein CpaC